MDYQAYSQYTNNYFNSYNDPNALNNYNNYSYSNTNYSQQPNPSYNSTYDNSSCSNTNYNNPVYNNQPPNFCDFSVPPPNFNNPPPNATYNTFAPLQSFPQNQSYNYESLEYDNNYYTELQHSDNLIPKDVPEKSQDDIWIENWLANLKNIDSNKKTNPINSSSSPKKPVLQISSARMALKKSLLLLDKLDSIKQHLNDNIAVLNLDQWKEKCLEIGALKEELSSLIMPFQKFESLKVLRRAVDKRKKIRVNMKQRKALRKEKLSEQIQMGKKKEKLIDDWLESMKEAVEKAKMQEQENKNRDLILSEVTKKKSDARKQLSLISSLIKLRNVRESVAVNRGEKTSLEDRSAFSKVTDKLTTMWEDALKSYTLEDQTLRKNIEQKAAEDKNEAKQAKENRIMQEWDLVLFGPKIAPSRAYCLLTVAERNLDTFAAIRKSWDKFLCEADDNLGSKIPIGWVLPDVIANQNWTKYLQN